MDLFAHTNSLPFITMNSLLQTEIIMPYDYEFLNSVLLGKPVACQEIFSLWI
jgi:hypothetical protein